MTPEQLAYLVDAVHQASYAIVGSIWALIFAVTWKG